MGCDEEIGRNEKYVECKSKCAMNFHITCADVSEQTFVKLREDDELKNWICKECSCDLTSTGGDQACEQIVSNQAQFVKLLSDKVNQAVERAARSLANVFKVELSKLTSENIKLNRKVDELQAMLNTQIAVNQNQSCPSDGDTSLKCVVNQVERNNYTGSEKSLLKPETSKKIRVALGDCRGKAIA